MKQFNIVAGSSLANSTSANIVSTYQGGCFFGALLAYPLAERFGRKPCMIGSGLIFCVGASIMFASKHSLGAIYAGRIIGGFAVGAVSLCIPL
jgi:MFS family permease